VAYVLIVEPDVERAGAYSQLVVRQDLEIAVVHDGDDAKAFVGRRGPPVLMLTELSLARCDGFALVEEVRRHADRSACAVLVTSAFASLRRAAQEAAARLGIDAVFARDESLDAVGTAIREGLHRVLGPALSTRVRDRPQPSSPHSADAAADMELAAVAADSARAFDVPLGAVYLNTGQRELFAAHCELPAGAVKASDRWTFLREVFETGHRLIVPDAVDHPVFAHHPLVQQGLMRGLVCVPLLAEGTVVGALCLIDIKPLAINASELDALAAYGRTVGSDIVRPPAVAGARPGPRGAAVAAHGIERHQTLVNEPVTSMATRQRAEQEIAREVSRAQRTRTALSCVLLDVDTLPGDNPAIGREPADEVQRRITQMLTQTIRGSDLTVRWGEEFLLVLPGVSRDGARTVADRVRGRVQQLPMSPPVTISAGVAEISAHPTVDDALAEAKKRLAQAKATGLNRDS
jgi:diguanylate cyclase (GGDEF)-like protein